MNSPKRHNQISPLAMGDRPKISVAMLSAFHLPLMSWGMRSCQSDAVNLGGIIYPAVSLARSVHGV